MTSTDPILAHLAARRAEHQAAGLLAEVQRIDQQVIAVRTLARLAEERGAVEASGDADAVAAVDAQARYWARQVDLGELATAAATADTTSTERGGVDGGQTPAVRGRRRS